MKNFIAHVAFGVVATPLFAIYLVQRTLAWSAAVVESLMVDRVWSGALVDACERILAWGKR